MRGTEMYKIEILNSDGTEVISEDMVPRFLVFGEHKGRLDGIRRFRLTHLDQDGKEYGTPYEYIVGTRMEIAAALSQRAEGSGYFLPSTESDPENARYISDVPDHRITEIVK